MTGFCIELDFHQVTCMFLHVTRNIVTEAISKGLRPKKRFFLCFKLGVIRFHVFAVCTILGETELEYSVQWFSVTQIRGMLKSESAQEVLLLSVREACTAVFYTTV